MMDKKDIKLQEEIYKIKRYGNPITVCGIIEIIGIKNKGVNKQ